MYIQATKARIFGNDSSLKRILSAKSPGEMKFLGSKIRNFNQETWAKAAMNIAITCHQAKFAQHASGELPAGNRRYHSGGSIS